MVEKLFQQGTLIWFVVYSKTTFDLRFGGVFEIGNVRRDNLAIGDQIT